MIIVSKVRSSYFTKEKDAIYNSRVDNSLSNREYRNKEVNNTNNINN